MTFGPLFLFMGIGKMISYSDTVGYLQAGFVDTWLPKLLVAPLAYGIPFWEVLIGVLLTLGLWYRAGLMVLAALMAALIFGLAVQSNHEVVGRNLAYVIIVIFALKNSHENPFSLDSLLSSRRG